MVGGDPFFLKTQLLVLNDSFQDIVTYSLTGSGNTYFSIDPKSGVLQTITSLLPETRETYTVCGIFLFASYIFEKSSHNFEKRPRLVYVYAQSS